MRSRALILCGALGAASLGGVLPGLAAPEVDLGKPRLEVPLSFERNEGQTDGRVAYLARGNGFSLFLTRRAAVFSLARDGRAAAVRMQFEAPSAGVRIVGESRLAGIVNYFIGQDASGWRTAIPTFERVRYEGIWDGVDLVFYGNGGALEYDLVLAPGADPSAISFTLEGADGLSVNDAGTLVIRTPVGGLVHHAPRAFQETSSGRREVTSRYVVKEDRVGFGVGSYDSAAPLVIDPLVALSYSTFLGGVSDDQGNGVASDAAGNAYIAGASVDAAPDYPTTSGAFDPSHNGGFDAYVTKLNAAGTALIYSTFLGGSGDDLARGISLDSSGNAYVTGSTADAGTDFPTTAGAFDTTHNGLDDAFVVKLNPSGSTLVYSTFLGGSGNDVGLGLVSHPGGNAYATGVTEDAATDFPTTAGAFDTTHNGLDDVFVSEVNSTGTGLLYSTFLGGAGDDLGTGVTVDSAGNAFVTGATQDAATDFPTIAAFDATHNGGTDAFAARLNVPGNALLYSTFLGGAGSDLGGAIAIDSSGNAYVTGATFDAATDFPTTTGAFDTTHNGDFDAFATKIGSLGNTLSYSTFLGGSGEDTGNGIAVDGSGNAYLTGATADAATDLPVTTNAFDTTHNGSTDAYVTEFISSGNGLNYSTFLGGSSADSGRSIAVNSSSGNAFVTGETQDGSTDLPTTTGAFDTTHNGSTDAFAVKFVPAAAPSPTPTASPSPSPSPTATATTSPTPTPTSTFQPGCTGTSGNDILIGTQGADTCRGFEGDDGVRALGGNDSVFLGPGNDVLRTGGGDDLARGAGGNDFVGGGVGADDIRLGAGDDVARAGGGNDTINCGAGNDGVAGGPGTDTFRRNCEIAVQNAG